MKNSSIGYKLFSIFNILFILIFTAVMITPYLHVLAKAFNDGHDSAIGGIGIWPRSFTTANVGALLTEPSILKAAWISLLRVVVGTITCLLVQFGAAYTVKKKSLPGRTLILVMFMIPMFFSGGLIPHYVLYSKVGLINNFFVYIIPQIFNFFHVIIIRTYMNDAIPDSIEESAKIDGANDIRIFFTMIIPMCKPILATVAVWLSVYQWNTWTDTLYYITKSQLYTLQYKLIELIKESERIEAMIREALRRGVGIDDISMYANITPDSMVSAQIFITTIPIIMVYPFFQRYFVNGIRLGAVKE